MVGVRGGCLFPNLHNLNAMPSNIVVFPFDLFGSSGTGAGAQLLGDAVREMIDDTEQETQPTRADAFRGKLRVKEVPFETLLQTTEWRKRGRAAARQSLRKREFLVWLAGNHLGVVPVFEQLPAGTLVVQFDAHLDINDFHDTTTELSHGNFLLHLPKPKPRLVCIGHRDLFQKREKIDQTFEVVFPAEALAVNAERVVAALQALASTAEHIWIDVDCDALDPAVLPAVHQPLPFGIMPLQFLKLLDAVWSSKVIGVSFSEFDPGRDVRDTSLNLLGWLIEWILLKRHENETAG